MKTNKQKSKEAFGTYLKSMLLENECIVEFTKVNGDKRVMPCTLNTKLMPEQPKEDKTKEKKVKKPNDNVLNVWCTDEKVNNWRSFRIENVTNIKIKD